MFYTGCGWCIPAKCVRGSAFGPDSGRCARWFFGSIGSCGDAPYHYQFNATRSSKFVVLSLGNTHAMCNPPEFSPEDWNAAQANPAISRFNQTVYFQVQSINSDAEENGIVFGFSSTKKKAAIRPPMHNTLTELFIGVRNQLYGGQAPPGGDNNDGVGYRCGGKVASYSNRIYIDVPPCQVGDVVRRQTIFHCIFSFLPHLIGYQLSRLVCRLLGLQQHSSITMGCRLHRFLIITNYRSPFFQLSLFTQKLVEDYVIKHEETNVCKILIKN